MCHQTVGLVGAQIEAAGIATVGLSLLAWITRRVRPPRSLVVPFPLGYPLGKPGDRELQIKIILAALALLERTDTPLIESFDHRARLGMRP